MTEIERSPVLQPTPAARGYRLGFALTVIAAAGFFITARMHSWYFSDDYIALHLVATKPFLQFLLTPIDVHFLPLHRFATWLIFELFGLDFDVALLVMTSFHLFGAWLLYRTLRLLGDSPLHVPLTVLYAANFYAGISLTWWTSGIARFPYVVFSLLAIQQFLRFRQDGKTARIAVTVLAMVGAAAFFTKALLIPGILIALELALLPEAKSRKALRSLLVIVTATGAAFAYYQTGVAYGVDAVRTPPFDWTLQKAALELVAAKVPQSFVGLLPTQPLSLLNRVVLGGWGAFFVLSVWRSRFNFVIWVIGVGVVLANFLVITLSQRMAFGPGVVANDRYYFEILYLMVIFAALITRRMRLDAWWGDARSGRVAMAGVWLVTALFAVNSQVTLFETLNSPRYHELRAARQFGLNLTHDLAELRRTNHGTLHFADGLVPLEILKVAAMEIRIYSEVLPLFDPDITVAWKGPCLYRVRDDGTIAPPSGPCP